jgi:hypothetical protein
MNPGATILALSAETFIRFRQNLSVLQLVHVGQELHTAADYIVVSRPAPAICTTSMGQTIA